MSAEKKLPILFLLNHFYPEVGAIRTEYHLSITLKQIGNDVSVVTTFPRKYRVPNELYEFIEKYKRKFFFFERLDGVKVYRFKSWISSKDVPSHRILELISSLPILSIGSLLVSLIKKAKVIIAGGDLEPIVAFCTYLTKFLLRIPVVVVLHDITSQQLCDAGILKKESLLYKVIRLLEILMFRLTDAVVVHSPSNKKIAVLKGADPRKVHVVFLWTDIDKVKPISPEEKKTCVFSNKFVVYYGGVLSFPQGPEVIVDAANIVSKYTDDILFLVVGEGPEKEKLVKKARVLNLNNIVFKPFQPWERHVQLLRCADVSLVTLRKEYTQPVVPSKLIEIMSAGCVPILSVPRSSDAVKIAVMWAKAGIWVEPGDPKALANAILKLYENPGFLLKLKKRARKFAEKFFSLKENAKKYHKLLLSLISEK